MAKSLTILFIAIEIALHVQTYETPFEDKFQCKSNGEISEPRETILVLSPHDEYFFKKMALYSPTGTIQFVSPLKIEMGLFDQKFFLKVNSFLKQMKKASAMWLQLMVI